MKWIENNNKVLVSRPQTAQQRHWLHPEIQLTYKLCQMTWTLNNSKVKSYSTFFQLIWKPNTIRMSNMLKINTSWSGLIRVLLDYQRLLRIHVWVSKQTLHKVNYFWLFKLIYPDPLLQSTFGTVLLWNHSLQIPPQLQSWVQTVHWGCSYRDITCSSLNFWSISAITILVLGNWMW